MVSLAGPAMTMATRLVLHTPWMIYWRYRVAARRGFHLLRCLAMVAVSYGLAYLVGIMLTGGVLLIVWVASLDKLVFPSFAAALLAPAVLYWMNGEIFDSAVAKAAQAERETLSGAL